MMMAMAMSGAPQFSKEEERKQVKREANRKSAQLSAWPAQLKE